MEAYLYENFLTLDPETMMEMEAMRLEFENIELMGELMNEFMGEPEVFSLNDDGLPF